MTQTLQAIRGMNDILPEDAPYWSLLDNACRRVARHYHYSEIRFPILESTQLFQRSMGQDTDIIAKEMYSFDDRNGDSVTLRPEGTAGCLRACIQHGLLHNAVQRVWYSGPMFRYERPQKGRYRQFHQLGVEAYGMASSEIEAELLLMSARLWYELDLHEHVSLQLNTLGSNQARHAYREVLVDYFKAHYDALDEDSQRRLLTNPLRILDSKNPAMQSLIAQAPSLMNHLDDASKQHFDRLCLLLDDAGLAYTINPRLVRGLDYYQGTVFEWVTDLLGSQGAVCAGGRYDGLAEQLGGKPTPAIGFAAGLERLVLLLQATRTCEQTPDVYAVLVGDAAMRRGVFVVEQLRNALPELSILTHLNGGSFKSQFKRADKSGAAWALVIAEDEVATEVITLKDLRGHQPQKTLKLDEAIAFFRRGWAAGLVEE